MNQTADLTRRRRECLKCGNRFTTYERVEEIMPAILKKDGRSEPFAREKLLNGIQKSCQKRPVTAQQIESMVSTIEKRIQSFGVKEVPSRTLGQMVMNELHKVDKVSYVRFASVYREFHDVDDFVAELQEAPTPPEDPVNLTFPFVASLEEPNEVKPSPRA